MCEVRKFFAYANFEDFYCGRCIQNEIRSDMNFWSNSNFIWLNQLIPKRHVFHCYRHKDQSWYLVVAFWTELFLTDIPIRISFSNFLFVLTSIQFYYGLVFQIWRKKTYILDSYRTAYRKVPNTNPRY